jgi:hypothetical protein
MFQLSAFQRSAFQIGYVANQNEETTGKGSFVFPYQKYQEQFQRDKIAEEKEKLERLEAQQIAAKKQAALEVKLLAQIDELRIRRALLIQRIRDEEAILVLIMALKRRRVG